MTAREPAIAARAAEGPFAASCKPSPFPLTPGGVYRFECAAKFSPGLLYDGEWRKVSFIFSAQCEYPSLDVLARTAILAEHWDAWADRVEVEMRSRNA